MIKIVTRTKSGIMINIGVGLKFEEMIIFGIMLLVFVKMENMTEVLMAVQ